MEKSILFVCLGNICRSPSAEAVFKAIVDRNGLGSQFTIDSAGTGAWHAGQPADKRMRQHARRRGYSLTSIARQFDPVTDYDKFDYIIGMDDENIRNLAALARDENDLSKLSKMTDYCKTYNYDIVPDPYYGGDEGFELVLDLLEDAGEGLLQKIKEA